MKDSILEKHPYLAESTPLRHMAKCLRHAIKNHVPEKLSPVEKATADFSSFSGSSDNMDNIEPTMYERKGFMPVISSSR